MSNKSNIVDVSNDKFKAFRKSVRSVRSRKQLLELIKTHLRPYQVKCFLDQILLLERGNLANNVSEKGSGKTTMAVLSALYMSFNDELCTIDPNHGIVIFCPEQVITHWERECNRWGVKIALIMSYIKLKGRDTVSHPWLIRNGESYEATEQLKGLYNTPKFTIYDEIQYAKNPIRLLQPALTVISGVAMRQNSPILLISAMAFTDKQHAIMFSRLCGIVTYPELAKIEESGSLRLTGLQQLIDYCNNIDSAKTKALLPKNFIPQHVPDILYSLTTKLLIMAISVAAGSRESKCVIESRFYTVEPEILREVLEIESTFKRSRGMAISNNSRDMMFSSQNIYDERTEYVKCREIIPNEIASNNELYPKSQHICFVSRHKSAELLLEILSEQFPGQDSVVVLNSAVKPKARTALIAKFNAPNSNIKVLVCSPKVCSTGLELDNKHTTDTRFVYGCPDNVPGDIFQSWGRTDRDDSASKSIFINIYIDGVKTEQEKANKLLSHIEVGKDSIGQKYEPKVPIRTTKCL